MDNIATQIRQYDDINSSLYKQLGITPSQFKYICKKYNIEYTRCVSGGRPFNAKDKHNRKVRTTLKNRFLHIGNKYTYKEEYVKLVLDGIRKIHEPVIRLSDIKHSLPYENGTQLLKPQVHNGQRKLFLSEVQFLNTVDQKYCIYAGASPGNKTHYLSQLFPDVKFILIDPNKFDLIMPDLKSHRTKPHPDVVHLSNAYPTNSKVYNGEWVEFIKRSSHKIFIIENYMTDALAHMFKELDHVFISDIRSNSSRNPSDFDIIWNSSMMFNWIVILQPVRSMLKFRPLYLNDDIKVVEMEEFETSKKFGIDFIGNLLDKKYIMPKSTLYIQAWAGKTSSELRMWIDQKDILNFMEYDSHEISNKMFYFNGVDRGLFFHSNNNANKKLHFCHCNDCALENVIWKEYSGDIIDNIIQLGKRTYRPLYKVHNNNIFSFINVNILDTFMERDNTDRCMRLAKNKDKKYVVHKGDLGKEGGIDNDDYFTEKLKEIMDV